MTENKNKGLSVGWRLTFVILILCSAMALAFWMVIARVWPATILIDLQLKWFNGYYYPKFTIAISCIFILLLPITIMGFISWLIKKIKRT